MRLHENGPMHRHVGKGDHLNDFDFDIEKLAARIFEPYDGGALGKALASSLHVIKGDRIPFAFAFQFELSDWKRYARFILFTAFFVGVVQSHKSNGVTSITDIGHESELDFDFGFRSLHGSA